MRYAVGHVSLLPCYADHLVAIFSETPDEVPKKLQMIDKGRRIDATDRGTPWRAGKGRHQRPRRGLPRRYIR